MSDESMDFEKKLMRTSLKARALLQLRYHLELRSYLHTSVTSSPAVANPWSVQHHSLSTLDTRDNQLCSPFPAETSKSPSGYYS